MSMVDFRHAQEIEEVLKRHGVRYLFMGKLAAILLGFDDTTEDADIFVDPDSKNRSALPAAMRELGFALTSEQAMEIESRQDIVQLENGPFDVDLVFAPFGMGEFEGSWGRRVEVDGLPVCHIDDIITIKETTNREKDRDSLYRLRSFREGLIEKNLSD
jgi:hypothetical protein